MTGEQRMESLITAAVEKRGWMRSYSESVAWNWLAAETGVPVRWAAMTAEQRFLCEARLERHEVETKWKNQPKKKRKWSVDPEAVPHRDVPLDDEQRAAVRLVLKDAEAAGVLEVLGCDMRLELGRVG